MCFVSVLYINRNILACEQKFTLYGSLKRIVASKKLPVGEQCHSSPELNDFTR
jgi:hypothetical protein